MSSHIGVETDSVFTVEYIKKEIFDFYGIIGISESWDNPEKMNLGLRAIIHLYLNCKEDTEPIMEIMCLLFSEYDNKLFHSLMKGYLY